MTGIVQHARLSKNAFGENAQCLVDVAFVSARNVKSYKRCRIRVRVVHDAAGNEVFVGHDHFFARSVAQHRIASVDLSDDAGKSRSVDHVADLD